MRGRKDEAKEAFLLLDGLVTLSLSLSTATSRPSTGRSGSTLTPHSWS